MHEPVEPRQRHVAPQVLLAQQGEARHFARLLAVRAHDARAGEVLLRARRERGEVLLHGLEAVVHHPPEPHHQDRDQHRRQHREPGELEVDPRHAPECEDAAEDGVREVHDGRAGGHAHGAQVVGESRHDVARAHPREPPRVQREQPLEERIAQVVLDVPRQAVHHLAHEVAQRARAQRDRHHHHADPPRRRDGRAGAQAVETSREQARNRGRRGGGAHHAAEAGEQRPAMRPEVRGETEERAHSRRPGRPGA